MPKFEVHGKHYKTNKKQIRIYEANDEFQAVEYGLADGLIVEKSTIVQDEPKNDSQLFSAKDAKFNERIDKIASFFEKFEKDQKSGVKKCRYCAMMIPKEAKICPYCTKTVGWTLPAKIFLWLIIFGVIGSFIAKNVRETPKNQPVAPRIVSRPVRQPEAPHKVETSYSRRAAGTETISAGEHGRQWPFTVPRGQLACSGVGAVTFTANGKTYAVNGLAMSDSRNSNIREIWKDDSESEHAKYMLKQGRPDLVPKISIGPIVERGLKLCK